MNQSVSIPMSFSSREIRCRNKSAMGDLLDVVEKEVKTERTSFLSAHMRISFL